MAVGANFTSIDAAFKQFYADGIEDLTYHKRALFGLLPKKSGWMGANQATRAWHIPLKFALPPAVSYTFTVAQNRAANVSSKVVAWELLSRPAYSFIQIDNESIMRSRGNEGAFVELKSLEVNGIIQNLSNRLNHYCYLDGTGVIARVGNATQMPAFNVSVCKLLNPEDAVKIAFGDELAVAATAGGAYRAFGANAHGLYVIGTDYDVGSFTSGTLAGAAVNLNDANDGIPTIANSDFIFHRGDGAGGGTVLSGFQSWIPASGSAPTNGDNQYNVDRSQNVDFLAGSRFDASNYGIEEALVRSSNVVAKKDGMIEQIFVNFKHYSDLVSAISARGTVDFMEASPAEYPDIGYKGVRIIGANTEIDVIPDFACPSTMGTGMKIEDWWFASVEEPVHTITSDGLEFLRLGTADGLEARFASYSNMVPRSPRDNINITLPA